MEVRDYHSAHSIGRNSVPRVIGPMGLNANKLAKHIEVPANRVEAIINGERGIAGEAALRLCSGFGATVDFSSIYKAIMSLSVLKTALTSVLGRSWLQVAQRLKSGVGR
jgi:addiction module HigA family antidote